MRVEILNEKTDEIFDALVAGVREFNATIMGEEASRPLMAIAHDEQGNLVGGVAGRTIYRQFLIEVVWVHESKRGAGLGRGLMDLAEQEARKRGCVAAQVDTLSFQAPDFYANLGFEVIGEVRGIQGSFDRYFMLKKYQE